ATRPFVRTSSIGMPTTVSVRTCSPTASTKARESSIWNRNAAGSRMTYCRTRAIFTILVSPVSSSMPEGASVSPARKKILWAIERKLAEENARPIIFYNRDGTCEQPLRQGADDHGQQHFQRLAYGRRLAR